MASVANTSTNTKIVGGAALAFLTYSYAKKFWMKSHPVGKEDGPSQALVEIDDGDDGEALDPESDEFIQPGDIIAIFDRLFLEMQAIVAQLSQQIQQIQMSGQNIPSAQIQQILKGEFERVLLIKQKQAYTAYNLDEDCVEEATWEFMRQPDKYPKVVKTVQRFQRLWENISGESCVGIMPGDEGKAERKKVEILSPSRTVEVAEVYFGALTKAMKNIVEEFKATPGKSNLQDPNVAKELQMQFASVANDAGEEALKKVGSSQEQFQESIQANSSNSSVGRALGMLQMQQQQEMMKLGIGPS